MGHSSYSPAHKCFLAAQLFSSDYFILLRCLQNCAYWVELGSNVKTLLKNLIPFLKPTDNKVINFISPASLE